MLMILLEFYFALRIGKIINMKLVIKLVFHHDQLNGCLMRQLLNKNCL